MWRCTSAWRCTAESFASTVLELYERRDVGRRTTTTKKDSANKLSTSYPQTIDPGDGTWLEVEGTCNLGRRGKKEKTEQNRSQRRWRQDNAPHRKGEDRHTAEHSSIP